MEIITFFSFLQEYKKKNKLPSQVYDSIKEIFLYNFIKFKDKKNDNKRDGNKIRIESIKYHIDNEIKKKYEFNFT